jgi:hypothetical protein
MGMGPAIIGAASIQHSPIWYAAQAQPAANLAISTVLYPVDAFALALSDARI